jgi:hypothetical protein
MVSPENAALAPCRASEIRTSSYAFATVAELGGIASI